MNKFSFKVSRKKLDNTGLKIGRSRERCQSNFELIKEIILISGKKKISIIADKAKNEGGANIANKDS